MRTDVLALHPMTLATTEKEKPASSIRVHPVWRRSWKRHWLRKLGVFFLAHYEVI